MKKLIILFIIGVLGIIAIISIQKAIIGDNTVKLICRNGQTTITIKLNPTDNSVVSVTNKNDKNYEIDEIDEKVEKLGVDKFIESFTHDFEINHGGTCFKK